VQEQSWRYKKNPPEPPLHFFATQIGGCLPSSLKSNSFMPIQLFDFIIKDLSVDPN
jgi:hypothetical protein